MSSLAFRGYALSLKLPFSECANILGLVGEKKILLREKRGNYIMVGFFQHF